MADDFTIGYLRRIGQEMSAIRTASDGISDNHKKLDFVNDAISLRVVPLVDRIWLGIMDDDNWTYSKVTVGYTNTAGGMHPVLNDPKNVAEGIIDLTTMARPITL